MTEEKMKQEIINRAKKFDHNEFKSYIHLEFDATGDRLKEGGFNVVRGTTDTILTSVYILLAHLADFEDTTTLEIAKWLVKRAKIDIN